MLLHPPDLRPGGDADDPEAVLALVGLPLRREFGLGDGALVAHQPDTPVWRPGVRSIIGMFLVAHCWQHCWLLPPISTGSVSPSIAPQILHIPMVFTGTPIRMRLLNT